MPMLKSTHVVLALLMSAIAAPAAHAATPRLAGKLVMADLVTSDIAVTQKFYQELFGWTFHSESDHVNISNGDQFLGGMFQRPPPAGQPAQPRWISYFSAADLSRVGRKVEAAGGSVLMKPVRLPDRGMQAVYADTEGALFGVTQLAKGDPEDYLPETGDWIWAQLLSHDATGAGKFYQDLSGYEVIQDTQSGVQSGLLLSRDGYARAAISTIPMQWEAAKAAWLPFVRVKLIGDSIANVKRLGGKVLLEPSASLAQGKVAIIADPTGAALGVLEWNE